MSKIMVRFERCVVLVLLLLMMVAVFLSTIELGVILYEQLMAPPVFLLDIQEMTEVFGFFLMVLIGLELLETIKAYLQKDKVHVEVVFLVAMVAISRKVITLEYKTMEAELLYGMSAIIISLAAGYYFVRRAFSFPKDKPESEK